MGKQDIEVGDVVIVLSGDGHVYDRARHHGYKRGDPYIVTEMYGHRTHTILPSDPHLVNSWASKHFEKATKLDHLLLGIRHANK